MASFEARLLHREQIAENSLALRFSRPAGYDYLPGQSLMLTLVDPPQTDAKGNSRELSFASAPHEHDLLLAVRMRDTAFKRVLGALPIGAAVFISEPEDGMQLHRDMARPAVFMAGGIGITPFLSMLRHLHHAAVQRPIYLFYSNWRPESSAFLGELQSLEKTLPDFHLITTMTDPQELLSSWSGERGLIDPQLLKRHLPDLRKPIYYLAGPPDMTLDLVEMLEDLGVAGQTIHSSEFAGY